MENIVTEVKQKMSQAFEMLRQDFATVRTGKANAGLVENIVINAYSGTAKLKVMELATIHATDPQTIVISPFDHSVIAEIQKGITDSAAGLNPIVDENILRINIPPLTEERRREFVKMINQKGEQGKIMIRQVRHDGMNEAKKQAEAGGVSEDEVTRIEKEIQRLTDDYMEKIDSLREEKEAELMKL